MTGVDGFTEALRWVVWLALPWLVVALVVALLIGRRVRNPHAACTPAPGRAIFRPCKRCAHQP